MRVSVITVAWNAAKTIGDTLDSVVAQSYPDLEHIVVDGASTDATAEVVARHRSLTTRFVSEPDAGLYDAMNKGIALATGDIIGFLNADDFFCRTDAVALIAAHIADYDAVAGSVAIVAAADPTRLRRGYQSRHFAAWMLRFGHMPPHPGFYARRSAFRAVGPFDPTIRIGADFEWMVRFFLGERLSAVALPKTIVAVRDGGLSNSGFASRRAINREALTSLRRSKILTFAPLLWCKYLLKVAQFWTPPEEWPASPEVGWPKAIASR